MALQCIENQIDKCFGINVAHLVAEVTVKNKSHENTKLNLRTGNPALNNCHIRKQRHYTWNENQGIKLRGKRFIGKHYDGG
jgi:hypothetical protein